jgi:hypothetical protein
MGNSREQALELYAWNLDISSALIVPLQVCEVAVRNGISEAIEAVHGANWPWNNGFIRSLPRPKSKFRYNPADDLQLCARRLPTTGKIIAELKFAFGKTSSQPARTAGCGTHFRTFFPGRRWLSQFRCAGRKPMLTSRPFGTCAIGSPTTSPSLREIWPTTINASMT